VTFWRWRKRILLRKKYRGQFWSFVINSTLVWTGWFRLDEKRTRGRENPFQHLTNVFFNHFELEPELEQDFYLTVDKGNNFFRLFNFLLGNLGLILSKNQLRT